MEKHTDGVPVRERPSWAFWLGCTEETFDEPGLKLIRNERLDKAATIIVLSTRNGALLSIPARDCERYEAKLAPLAEKHLVAMVDVINALGSEVRQAGYILWQGSLEPEHFRPRAHPDVRRMEGADLQTLHGLQAACHPTEWAHSCLSDTSDTAYGIRKEGELAAAAHYIFLRPGLSSIGVLTHPRHRGMGYAGAVVSAAMQRAIDDGHSLHYQTLLENYHSIALAERLGVRMFGLSMQIRLHA